MRKTIFALLAALVLGACSHTGKIKGINIGLDLAKGPAPTWKEAQAWRNQQKYEEVAPGKWAPKSHVSRETKPQPTLINGEAVDLEDWPSVVRIFSGGSSCTANVVGARVIATAAHCARDRSTVRFRTITGKTYTARITHAPGYPQRDIDLALGITSEIIDVPPMTLRTDRFERRGMSVRLIGYGCTRPGGGGGNDGVLRTGLTRIVAGQNYDLVTRMENGAALCFGDSGGPAFWKDEDGGVYYQIAVNSKGNIRDTSYLARWTLEESRAFLTDWAADNNTTICGVNANCLGQNPPDPGPKKGKLEDENIVIEYEVKG